MFPAQQLQFFTAVFLALASSFAHALPYSQLVVIGLTRTYKVSPVFLRAFPTRARSIFCFSTCPT